VHDVLHLVRGDKSVRASILWDEKTESTIRRLDGADDFLEIGVTALAKIAEAAFVTGLMGRFGPTRLALWLRLMRLLFRQIKIPFRI
jgi:hypothetical protein